MNEQLRVGRPRWTATWLNEILRCTTRRLHVFICTIQCSFTETPHLSGYLFTT